MIAKANEVMNIFYSNAKEREAYLAASKYECDRVSMINESKREGIAQGMATGERNAKIAMAKMMKNKNFAIDVIMEMTGLSIEEIEKL